MRGLESLFMPAQEWQFLWTKIVKNTSINFYLATQKKKAVTPAQAGGYCIPPSFEIKKNTMDTGLRRYDDFIFLLR